MKVMYDECIEALRDNKCSECNDFYQCSICDYFQQRYEQGKAEAIEEFKKRLLANEVVDKSVVRRVSEQLKEENNE